MKIYKIFFVLSVFLMSCSTSNHSKKITIHTIGDSTMAIKPDIDKNPERGWVQVLPQFFKDDVQIFNHAVNGRSTKSFRELGHWKPVLESLRKGDYLFIQFGHNDAKDTDPVSYTHLDVYKRQG